MEDPQERPRLESEISARLSVYCAKERRTRTAAVNTLMDRALAEWEATQKLKDGNG